MAANFSLEFVIFLIANLASRTTMISCVKHPIVKVNERKNKVLLTQEQGLNMD
jgi:hypothetical protein